MKTGIHPKYHAQTKTKCVCGATFDFGSTVEEISTEICSQCHPFYTGKQKLVDTAGKVDKFRAKMEKAKAGEAGKKKSEISESVRVAASAKAGTDSSALGSKKLVSKVKASRTKSELAAQQAEEAKLKAKEEAKNAKAEDSPETKDAAATEPAEKPEASAE